MSETKLNPSHLGGIVVIVLGSAITVSGFVFWAIMQGEAEHLGGTYIPGFLPVVLIFGGLGVITAGTKILRSAGHRKKTTKVRLASGAVKVFQETDSRSPEVADLYEGDEFKLGAVKNVNGIDWVQISTPEGKTGYILGDAQIFQSLLAETLGRETPIYPIAAATMNPIRRLAEGSKLEICKAEWDAGQLWIRVWLPDGEKGYIKLGTKVNWI